MAKKLMMPNMPSMKKGKLEFKAEKKESKAHEKAEKKAGAAKGCK